MKIISFQRGMPIREILSDLQKKVTTKTERLPWRCYDEWSCLCIKDNIYEQFCEHFRRYQAMVEENVTVCVHAKTEAMPEGEEEIPWGVRYVGAERLWRKGKGEGVKVAVIDTGISRDHFDLKGRIKGGVHFVRGKQNGHGTHVAGIIVAEMNQRGIVGVSPEADLYDVRAFDHEGKASLSTILQALQWSIANQMDVINMSFGMPAYSEALARAVEKAHERGIVMVASAGNSGGAVEYPARYKNVMGVSAIDQSGRLASFSARGKGADMKAPGVEILSTWPGNQFKKLNGTSMAAPHVSGLMALEIGRKRNKKK